MKKFLFLGIAATAMFASCTNDEMVEMNPSSAIGFETFVDKSTRATDVTTANLDAFWVYGWRNTVQIFNKQAVTLDHGDWTYTPLQYWVGGYEYYFEAVAPEPDPTKGITVNASRGASTITFESDSETDLIYASAIKDLSSSDPDLASDPGAVGLTFYHLLSRVKFTFKNGAVAGSAAKIAVSDVKITNAGTESVYTTSSGTWSPVTAPEIVTFLSTNITNIGGGASGETEHKYLIPCDDAKDYSVSFTVTMTQGSVSDSFPYTVKLSTNPLPLEKGKSYNFTATFNPGYPIEFTAVVDDWDDFTNVTIP